MLFKRASVQPLKDRVRNILWPDMGLTRLAQYYKHRSIRLSASDDAIARGLAVGFSISWTPPLPGTHILQCFVFSKLVQGSFVSSIIGSIFGNVWTFPFILYASHLVGKTIVTTLGYGDFFAGHSFHLSFDIFKEWRPIALMFIGGYAIGAVSYPVVYYVFLLLVKGARRAREMKIKQVLHLEHKKSSEHGT